MKRISAWVGTLCALALCALALLAPGPAVAQTTRHTAAAGALPFTRLDVLLLLAGSAALIAAGLVLRRVAGRLR